MCCTTLTLQAVTIRKPLRMNWVLVTDTNGNRRPQMHWRTIQ
jgi:hypothetical protein